jgi:hypothetical protein
MEPVMNAPVGKLIRIADGGASQWRWHDGHVYLFVKQYENKRHTGKWEATDFGDKENAKGCYPNLSDLFDRVCS